jgi:hypothetical protein
VGAQNRTGAKRLTFSPEKAWNEALAMLRAHKDILLIVAGVFILLPTMANVLFVPQPEIDGMALNLMQAWQDYLRENATTLFLLSLPVALGQAAILSLLLDPERPTVGDALGRALKMLPVVLVLGWIVQMGIMFGLLAFIVPGLYLFGRLLCAAPAQMAERIWNPITALQRSLELSRGNGWSILGTLAVVALLGLVIQVAVTSVFGIVARLTLPADAATIVTAVIAALITTLFQLALTLCAAAAYRQLAGPRKDAA